MKRFISCLLTGALVLAPCLQVSAGSVSSEIVRDASAENNPNVSEAAGTGGEMNGQTENTAAAVAGQVDVSVIAGMVLGSDVDFQISLTGQNAQTVTLKADAGGEKPQRGEARFEHLESGTYTLTVTAPGFADYTQEIAVDGRAYGLELATGVVSGYDYKEGSIHPGILQIGDVNGDGVVDENDKDQLMDAIDTETASGEANEDLNRDGEVNLADLEYFTKGYQIDGLDTKSTLKVSVPAAAVDVACSESTIVKEGDLESLLKNEGTVKLQREDGNNITKDSPVSVEFALSGDDSSCTAEGMVIESGDENPISSASFEIHYVENGEEQTVTVPFQEEVSYLLERSTVSVTQDENGSIHINFGNQVAVKRVILTIFGTKSSNNLAEISKVEFLGDMGSRIPEPALDIPQKPEVDSVGSKTFSVKWEECVNVTGYEVLVSGEDEEGKTQEEIKQVTGNTLTVTGVSWGPKGKLKNGNTYRVKVRAVNGTWRSGYSTEVSATPKATKVPDKPDYVTATGKYKAIDVTWKDMEDTDWYNLYYKEDGETEYTKVEQNIETNKYTISNLKDKTSYLVYVIGVNEIGESAPSLEVTADTVDLDPAEMYRYKLINSAEEGQVSEHIISATIKSGRMVDSPKDSESGTAWGTVDNDPISHYFLGSWDSGGFNTLGGNHGLFYEFDEAYKIQDIALQEVNVQSPNYGYAKVRYWGEDGKAVDLGHDSLKMERMTDSEGRAYYKIHLLEPITAKKIQFGISRPVASGTITVSEVYFYHYDSIADDIMALYEDDLHTVLREDVKQSTIDDLRTRINTKDEASGEYHPDKAQLEKELKTAEDILNGELSSSVRIHNSITTKDVGRGFGGLNAWQPLGVTAAAGEKITVYVGHNTKKTGDGTNLQLVATQYHAEAASMFRVLGTLKIGGNEITLPKLFSLTEEAGGALYVQYTAENANDQYAVRVSGGVQVPILDLYQVTDKTERQSRAEAYVEQLDDYVAKMESNHEEFHKNSQNALVNKYEYKKENCILGAADILLDTMMLSLPAQQIKAGSGSGSIQERAQKIVTSMEAMEEMMHLFYQHKGLNKTDSTVKEAIAKFPSGHLNIRYQRMFAGAFMYASGNHIGIEYPETRGMIGGVPVQTDANGKWEDGQYFGWGIAHEIGHCINQGAYAVAETTNNYFSVLAQAKDRNDSVRFQYKNVYDKVTSGATGPASNVFTQLGMYWQLHLAYDDGYNYKTYEKYDDQLDNLFFARVDTYARMPEKAPAPDGVALSLEGDSDQQLMRLSCAAAKKDILDFFVRWGKVPDQGTIDYAKQFEKETRAIYYGNDDSRVHRLTHSGSILSANSVDAVGDSTTAVLNETHNNQVDFTLAVSDNILKDDIHGFEIVRCMTSGGKVERQVVGFVDVNVADNQNGDGTYKFSDYVTTVNNRVMTYEVTLIDQYMYRSKVKVLPSVKIEHKGNIDKTNWTVFANGLESVETENTISTNEIEPCEEKTEEHITRVVDQDTSTVYTGEITADNAEILLEFNQSHAITGFEYTVGTKETSIGEYEIFVKDEKGAWMEKPAATGTFGEESVQTVYFSKHIEGKPMDNIAVYKTTAMKLVIKDPAGSKISIAELDALGRTGDNVDFRRTEDADKKAAIGRLADDYKYGTGAEDVIPKGSIVFTGFYKGNPAYNVVLLYDQNGENVGTEKADKSLNAAQVILADVPEGGNIQDVRDGTWIYWVEPDEANPDKQVELPDVTSVRAELYRVDNAETNEGQRLVSDSYFEEMPETLPPITLGGN